MEGLVCVNWEEFTWAERGGSCHLSLSPLFSLSLIYSCPLSLSFSPSLPPLFPLSPPPLHSLSHSDLMTPDWHKSHEGSAWGALVPGGNVLSAVLSVSVSVCVCVVGDGGESFRDWGAGVLGAELAHQYFSDFLRAPSCRWKARHTAALLRRDTMQWFPSIPGPCTAVTHSHSHTHTRTHSCGLTDFVHKLLTLCICVCVYCSNSSNGLTPLISMLGVYVTVPQN